MLLQLLHFSSSLCSRFSRWDIFLQYGKPVGQWTMAKVGKPWDANCRFYIAVSVSIVSRPTKTLICILNVIWFWLLVLFKFLDLNQTLINICRWHSFGRHFPYVRVASFPETDSSPHVLLLDTSNSHERYSRLEKTFAYILYLRNNYNSTCYSIIRLRLPPQFHAYSAW